MEKIKDKIASELATQFKQISAEFDLLKQENRRLSIENSLLETKTNFERAKIMDIEDHFNKVHEAIAQKDKTVSTMYNTLLSDYYKLQVLNTHLELENKRLKDDVKSYISSNLNAVTSNLCSPGVFEYPDYSKIYQTEISRIQELFNQHCELYQNLNSRLVDQLRVQSLNFSSKIESIIKYVLNLIEILKSSETKNQTKTKNLEFKLFSDDNSQTANTFLKLFNEKTLQENKFLLFCFEQVKRKLAEKQIDFPSHLLEPEFLLKNTKMMTENNPKLFASIESLFEENKTLEKQLFINHEIKLFQKRIKASKVDQIVTGLELLNESNKNSQSQEFQMISQDLENQIKDLQLNNSINFGKLSEFGLHVSNLESQLLVEKAKNESLNISVAEFNQRFLNLQDSFLSLQKNLSLVNSRDQSQLDSATKDAQTFIEDYSKNVTSFLSMLNEAVFDTKKRNEFRNSIDGWMAQISSTNQATSEMLRQAEAEIYRLKHDGSMTIEKVPGLKDITFNYSLSQAHVNKKNNDEKVGIFFGQFKHKLDEFSGRRSQLLLRQEQKVTLLKRKLARLKIDLTEEKKTTLEKWQIQLDEKVNLLRKQETEIQVLNLSRDKFIEYLQSKFKSMCS